MVLYLVVVVHPVQVVLLVQVVQTGTSGETGSCGSSGSSGSSGLLEVTDDGTDRVLTMDGDGTATAETNLTFDGGLLDVTGDLDVSDATFSTRFHENYSNIGNSAGGTTIDLSTANNFRINRTGTITISISNAPTGPRAIGFTLVMEDGSGGTATTNWPSINTMGKWSSTNTNGKWKRYISILYL